MKRRLRRPVTPLPPAAPGADTAAPTHVLKNRTAKRIAIQAAPGNRRPPPLIIPPFGQRALSEDEIAQYDYESWTRQLLVKKESVASAIRPDSPADILPKIAAYSLLAALVLFTLSYLMGLNLILAAAGGGALVIALLVWVGAWRISKASAETVNRMVRTLNVFLVGVIGIALPVTVTLGLRQYYVDTGNRDVFGFSLPMVWIFLGSASTLPAALYFWFHRQKMPVVREGFLRDIVRLDPNVQTLEDADTSYSALIDDVYGPNPTGTAAGQSSAGSGSLWGNLPILIATMLFAALWSWTLLSSLEHREDTVLAARRAAATAAGVNNYNPSAGPPPVPSYREEPPDTLAVLTPNPDIVSYAFLGSYFFALGMLFRRYTRSDLGPKTYTHVCVRIVTALTVSWAVSQVPFLKTSSGKPNATMLLLAFVIGIIPETGTAIIQDVLRSSPGIGNKIPSLQEDHPLDKLDGISLYDRSQLLEVGIENIESLAHNNLVELMLWTRIPTSRLVDFVDQAVLYLHVQGPAQLDGGRDDDSDGARKRLAAYGIRTATDLEREWEMTKSRSTVEEGFFLRLLDAPDAPVHRLQVILDAMGDDEWMVYLRNWRNQSLLTTPLATVDDFVAEAAAETESAVTGDENLLQGLELLQTLATADDN